MSRLSIGSTNRKLSRFYCHIQTKLKILNTTEVNSDLISDYPLEIEHAKYLSNLIIEKNLFDSRKFCYTKLKI